MDVSKVYTHIISSKSTQDLARAVELDFDSFIEVLQSGVRECLLCVLECRAHYFFEFGLCLWHVGD